MSSAAVNHERCVGCELCVRACGLTHAIQLDLEHNWVTVKEELCWECGACERMCPFSAIWLVPWAEPDKDLRDAITARRRSAKPARPAAAASSGRMEDNEPVATNQRG